MKLITILGPTASGKTSIAVAVAAAVDGEIISADSRQVYRGMDIGTGKDLHEYYTNGRKIPVHLIDIAEPGEEYNIFRFAHDFSSAWNDITSRGKFPVMCGGSGMYLSTVLQDYKLPVAEWDQEKLMELAEKDDEELVYLLKQSRLPHNTTDLTDRERLLKAVYISMLGSSDLTVPDVGEKKTFGIKYDREQLVLRITRRLEQRLENGMTDEVNDLLKSGVTPEKLKFYGLEYRFVTRYLENEISYNDMFRELNIAIRQFAKRQMTWFRRMERNGCKIIWIDGNLAPGNKLEIILRNI